MPVVGRAKIGSTPIGRLDFYDLHQPSKFRQLLASKDARRIYRVDLYPYDEVSLGTVLEQFIDAPWYQDRQIRERVKQALDLKSAIAARADEAFSTGGLAAGNIILQPTGEDVSELDYLAALNWDGREVRVYLGGEDFLYAEFEPVFQGVTTEILYTEDNFQITLADPNAALQIPIQNNTYGGTGGDDGGPEIAGFPKPLAFGEVVNATPVKVDDNLGSPIYQLHDGPIERYLNVFDRRLALGLPNGGLNDISELGVADVRDAVLEDGEWCQDVSKGIFRVASPPEGAITCDGLFAKFNGVFLQRAHALALAIMQTYGDPAWTYDLAAFSFLDAKTQALPNKGKVNLYVSDSANIADVVKEILQSVFAFQTFTRLGEISCFKFAFGTPVLTLEEKDIVSISKKQTSDPQFRRTLLHSRNWTPFSDASFAEIPDTEKEFFRKEYRPAIAQDQSIKTRRKLAGEATVATLLDGASPRWATSGIQEDATFLAQEEFDLLSKNRSEYEVVARSGAYDAKPGQTIRVKYPRWDLVDGKDFIAVGVGESSNSSWPTFRLWG